MNHLDEMQEEQRLYIVAQQQLHSMLLSDEHGVKAEYMEPQLESNYWNPLGIQLNHCLFLPILPILPIFPMFPIFPATTHRVFAAFGTLESPAACFALESLELRWSLGGAYSSTGKVD